MNSDEQLTEQADYPQTATGKYEAKGINAHRRAITTKISQHMTMQ
jgi:hypothetical protein